MEKFDWDEAVPGSVVKEWEAWLHSLKMLKDFLLPRWCFLKEGLSSPGDFMGLVTLNLAFFSVIYIRRLANGTPAV